MKKIAVIGAGNGGVSMGAYMSLSGARVNIYDKSKSDINALKDLFEDANEDSCR